MKSNIILNAMNYVMENLETHKEDFPDNLSHYTIDLGRQMGHTSAMIDFVNDNPNRCLIIARSGDIENIEYEEKLNEAHLMFSKENLQFALKTNSLEFLREKFKGRDIIIFDAYSNISKESYDFSLSLLIFLSEIEENLIVFKLG